MLQRFLHTVYYCDNIFFTPAFFPDLHDGSVVQKRSSQIAWGHTRALVMQDITVLPQDNLNIYFVSPFGLPAAATVRKHMHASAFHYFASPVPHVRWTDF